MNTVSIGSTSILIFAVLMLVGGIIGFRKARSKASLIAGAVSAGFLCGCFVYSLVGNPLLAFKSAFVIIGILDGVFLIRLIKTKKFMPSGMLLILCVIEQIILYSAMSIVRK